MRIISLTFRNLNSLCGTWTIDFTAPEFISSGIFAITGPTGSGKSTILDALCLALYGCTPRLPRVNKSGNEIMSRHTGECFAAVVFETVRGSYTAHWSQRRARGRPDGALQDAKHEIAHTGGAVIESKLSETEKKIVELTGMDFDRFTRSMLLAQGGFAKFLSATPDERSPILEQITGTGIYSTISMMVHDRFKRERETLDALKAELDGIVLLTDDEAALLRRNVESTLLKSGELGVQRAALSGALEWHRRMERLTGDLADAQLRLAQALENREAFSAEALRLKAALEAAELEGDYAVLVSLRKQNSDDGNELSARERLLPGVRAEVEAKRVQLENDRSRLDAIRRRIADHVPLLRQARVLDGENAGLQLQHEELEKQLEPAKQNCRKAALEYARLSDEKAALSESSRKGREWCDAHAADAGLAEEVPSFTDRAGQMVDSAGKCSVLRGAVERAQAELETAGEQSARCKSQLSVKERGLEAATETLRRVQDELQIHLAHRTLPDYRRERDDRIKEKYYVGTIIRLDEERKNLVDGKPCPLCGATQHPFSQAVLPGLSGIEENIAVLDSIIRRAEEFETRITDAEKTVVRIRQELADAQQEQTRAEGAVSLCRNTLAGKNSELAAAVDSLDKIRGMLARQGEPYGIEVPAVEDADSFIGMVKNRASVWKRAQEKLRKLEQDETANRTALLLAEQQKKNDDAALSVLAERQSLLAAKIAEIREKRRDIFGDDDPDRIEKNDAEELGKTEESLSLLTDALAEKERDAAAVLGAIEDLKGRIARNAGEIDRKTGWFRGRCAEAGFDSIETFTAVVIDPVERKRLADIKEKLETACGNARALVENQQAVIGRERAGAVPGEPPDVLDVRLKECECEMQRLSEMLGADRHRLENDAAVRERAGTQRERIDAQRGECNRWERLHVLIGSADGKKFRNFAQGITFEYLIAHANRQLSHLSDRYLLTNSPDTPLDLYVIDNYQAAEIRTARNLSGGESFIISLALALGLSSMAGRSIRVDSLFLDEGFGTLDEEALETALETLSTLHQEGKCIGVISHVQALKERIPTRITVTPVSGGKSVLSGPGCRRIDEVQT